MKTADRQASKPKMADYSHIVDDGDSDGHGYFLPKQHAVNLKSVGNCGVGIVDVPIGTLGEALASLSALQKKRLESCTS